MSVEQLLRGSEADDPEIKIKAQCTASVVSLSSLTPYEEDEQVPVQEAE